jgi:hypothetical protein
MAVHIRRRMNSIKEATLTKVKPEEKKKNDSELPVYYEQLKLSDEDKQRIIDEIFCEFDEIKTERSEKKLEEKWRALDNQYDGVVTEDDRRMFNLCRQTTRIKVNKVTNLIMQAFLKSDPKYSVTPRPEFEGDNAREVCDKQSDFLDYKLDNLPFRENESIVVHSSVLKGTGFLKVKHVIKREKRKREEVYKGSPQVVGQDPQTGAPIMKNEGLEEFLRNWPDAPSEYPGYVKELSEGKEIRFVAEFTETTYNDPGFTPVNVKNFYARVSCDGYEGLRTTKLTVERMEFTYWDLKKEEKRGFFYDIDDLTFKDKDNNNRASKYENKTYNILECVFYTKIKESDEEVKCVFWVDEEKKKMVGSILYPYYGIDCYYAPHYIMRKEPGLYGTGLGEILTDSHAAENAILNQILEAAWMQCLITPIVGRNSTIATQFRTKSWTHGVPLEADETEKVDFLQKYMQAPNVPGMITLLQFLLQGDDDATGVSSLMSGRESPLDPTAPASKTLALLQQSGVSIEDYILTIAPSFNLIGEMLFQLYYQMAQDGIKYRVSPDRATGNNPFAVLTRAEMMAKTVIQVQAASFNFDKLEDQKKDFTLYQFLRQEPLFNSDPRQVYIALKNIVKGWSPKWRILVDQILPEPGKLQKEQIVNALKATDTYVMTKMREAKVTGVPPQFDLRELVPMISQGQKLIATPMTKEEAKAKEGAVA